MRSARLLATVALLSALAAFAGVASAAPYIVDGSGADWTAADQLGPSTRAPTSPNATADLLNLYASDNATHWFFALNFLWTGSARNASFALYLFGQPDASAAEVDPSGNGVSFPANHSLLYAIYLDATPAFPSGCRVMFFDGAAWKNRTFSEFEVAAAMNANEGVIELGLPRTSFVFVHAGSAAAVELVPPPGGPAGPRSLVDAVPDAPAPGASPLAALAPFYDYTLSPPISFTALGVSNTGATEGETIQVFVELTNLGPKTAAGLSAQVLMDGVAAGTQSDLTLLPFGTAVLQFNWTATAGTHNVTATSLPGGASSSLPLVVRPAGANLRIVEAKASPASPTVGATFRVEIRVYNEGSQPAPPVRILLKDGTQVISSLTTAPLAPNGSATYALEARLGRVGSVTVRVEVDEQSSAESGADVTVNVQPQSVASVLLGPIVLISGVAACALAAWWLSPRIHARRARDLPPPETPPPLP